MLSTVASSGPAYLRACLPTNPNKFTAAPPERSLLSAPSPFYRREAETPIGEPFSEEKEGSESPAGLTHPPKGKGPCGRDGRHVPLRGWPAYRGRATCPTPSHSASRSRSASRLAARMGSTRRPGVEVSVAVAVGVSVQTTLAVGVAVSVAVGVSVGLSVGVEVAAGTSSD